MATYQKGYIFKAYGAWHVRYYDSVIENGKTVRKQVSRRLCDIDREHQTKSSVQVFADAILAPINNGSVRPESSLSLATFVDQIYLPWAKTNKRPSTYAGYEDIWNGKYLRPRVGGIRLRDFRTHHAEKALAEIARVSGVNKNTLKHFKFFLSGAFVYARRQGILDTPNPIRDVSIPEFAPGQGETYAYSLQEELRMIELLPEPYSWMVAVAAFSGMRRSEIRGLQVGDYRNDEIMVSRGVWYKHVTDPKTRMSKNPIPVIEPLKKVLEAATKGKASGEYIFAYANGRSVDLKEASRTHICPILTKAGLVWHGWHAFRRGLATNLAQLGVEDRVIQQILRHADLGTTQRAYIKTASPEAQAAMARLEKKLGEKANVN